MLGVLSNTDAISLLTILLRFTLRKPITCSPFKIEYGLRTQSL